MVDVGFLNEECLASRLQAPPATFLQKQKGTFLQEKSPQVGSYLKDCLKKKYFTLHINLSKLSEKNTVGNGVYLNG